MPASDHHRHASGDALSRRRLLRTSGNLLGAGALVGLSLPEILRLRAEAAALPAAPAKATSLIIVYLWGGLSHIDSLDPKPDAPPEVRGEFRPISTATPGIAFSEHLPRLARHTEKLAVIRSIHHDDAAHGRGMYWNLTGHKPPRVGNIPPLSGDWPSIAAMVSTLRPPPEGVPPAVRIPYPLVDTGTLQAGEYGGWLGVKVEPIIMRPSGGEPFAGVSRSLGAETFEIGKVDTGRVSRREELRSRLDHAPGRAADFASHDHFRTLARDILLGSAVRDAHDIDRESPRVLESYGNHIGGRSLLLARRLTEAGVPVVQVCCAAGDLNGASGDMWDTHGDNFNRLKSRLLPVFDRSVSALLEDLADRGTLGTTLVAVLTDFGRTPRVNGAAGRDHYPGVYSVALAGGGIRGGQVYGSSDGLGAFPLDRPCTPPDIHATLFHALGLSPRAELRDPLGRVFPATDGDVLDLF